MLDDRICNCAEGPLSREIFRMIHIIPRDENHTCFTSPTADRAYYLVPQLVDTHLVLKYVVVEKHVVTDSWTANCKPCNALATRLRLKF